VAARLQPIVPGGAGSGEFFDEEPGDLKIPACGAMVAGMITPDFVRLMARYNAWQNHSLYAAASGIPDAARRAERGAFFGSIHGTLSHLLWGDSVWLSRFGAGEAPVGSIAASPGFEPDWDRLAARRTETDARISDWSERVAADWLGGEIAWHSAVMGREVTRSTALCVVHFFNHQAHHRGQVHAMLTSAGARPEDTDLIVLPDQV
jgi:uncharacterized damage-inducible protein DinB